MGGKAMKLEIQVLGDANEVILQAVIQVPDDIPYPPLPAPQAGPISLEGLRTAVDYHLWLRPFERPKHMKEG
jgi:hypothetical protein